jgi:hypothetical protein
LVEIVAIGVVIATGRLVFNWLVLRFLWRVYDRGGVTDLQVAAAAFGATRWPSRPADDGGPPPTPGAGPPDPI